MKSLINRLAVLLLISTVAISTSANEISFFKYDGNDVEISKKGCGSHLVIFESGFGTDLNVWNNITNQLNKNEYTTISYSRLGIGNSATPSQIYTTEQHAEVLSAIINSQKNITKTTLVGHSIGGLIAQTAVTNKPNLVDHLILVDSATWGQRAAFLELDKNRVLKDDKMMLKYMPEQLSSLYSTLMNELNENADYVVNFNKTRVTAITSSKVSDQPFVLEETPQGKKVWLKLHADLLNRANKSHHIVLSDVGHNIHKDRPRLVIEQITAPKI